MSATVLYMSMSLDGFVAGPNESIDNGLGDGGERLHEWIFAGPPTEHGGVPGRPEGAEQVELEPLRVREGAGATHLRYRVRQARSNSRSSAG